MTEASSQKLKRIQFALVGAMVLGGAMFVAALFYLGHLRRTSPGEPNAESGQTLGMIDHSPIFYVRAVELTVFNFLLCGWALAVLSLAASRLIFGRQAVVTVDGLPGWLVDLGLAVLSIAALGMLGMFVLNGGQAPVAPVSQ